MWARYNICLGTSSGARAQRAPLLILVPSMDRRACVARFSAYTCPYDFLAPREIGDFLLVDFFSPRGRSEIFLAPGEIGDFFSPRRRSKIFSPRWRSEIFSRPGGDRRFFRPGRDRRFFSRPGRDRRFFLAPGRSEIFSRPEGDWIFLDFFLVLREIGDFFSRSGGGRRFSLGPG